MRIYQGAVVGCGFFSVYHLNGWSQLADRSRIAAVCDIDRARAGAMAERFNIEHVYDDVEKMLDEQTLDFIDIATTPGSHLSLVEACARRKLPAIVQKPIAPDWEQAVKLVEAMERAGAPLMVHENFRFQSAVMAAADRVREGHIGTPQFARFSFRTGYDIYKGQPYLAEVERFVLLDLGIHVLDVARYFMGEVETVFCQTQAIRHGIKGEDTATLMLRHKNGGVSVVDISYESHRQPDCFPQMLLEIDGTCGGLRIEPDYRLVTTRRDGTLEYKIAAPADYSPGSDQWLPTQDSVVSIQRHWLDCLETGAEPATSGRDNLRTFALVEAAYESAAKNEAVRPRIRNTPCMVHQ